MPDKDENTTEMIHEILETKLGMEDTRAKVKIDRSHRIGKRERETTNQHQSWINLIGTKTRNLGE